MEKAIELALRTNELLQSYIKIHDEIFGFSIRKIIPVPGIFKSIDYQFYYERLYFIKQELKEVLASVSASPKDASGFVDTLEDYVKALLETVSHLREMCGNLFEKSKNAAESYSKGTYKSDLNRYEGLALRYKELGQRLNSYFQRP